MKVNKENIKLFIAIGIIVFALIGLGLKPNTTVKNKVSTGKNEELKKSTETKEEVVITKDNKLYSVNRVIDGDTVDVDINGKVERLRLIGIDTPETVDPRKPVQCFGKEASNKAKELLEGKKIKLESDPTQGERDKYNRLLRFVLQEDGTNFNKWMIENGYAYEYTYNLPYKYLTEFKQAEKEAKENSRGLWSLSTCNGKP